MVILKLLYKITKVRTYQWTTYSKYHRGKLLIITFIFNPCFLITTIGTLFIIISIQTNNIIILKAQAQKIPKIQYLARLVLQQLMDESPLRLRQALRGGGMAYMAMVNKRQHTGDGQNMGNDNKTRRSIGKAQLGYSEPQLRISCEEGSSGTQGVQNI